MSSISKFLSHLLKWVSFCFLGYFLISCWLHSWSAICPLFICNEEGTKAVHLLLFKRKRSIYRNPLLILIVAAQLYDVPDVVSSERANLLTKVSFCCHLLFVHFLEFCCPLVFRVGLGVMLCEHWHLSVKC